MRAQVFTAAGRPLAAAELPMPRPGFAPVGALVPTALAATRKGGTVVCGGIHISDIPAFPYGLLWEERVVRSVANLTRRDAEEFLSLAPKAGVTTATANYPLAAANQALADCAPARFKAPPCWCHSCCWLNPVV